jgi:hypothetical protein
MKTLARILAFSERAPDAGMVIGKAVTLARHFGASVDLVVTDAEQMRAAMALCLTNRYEEVVVRCVHRGVGPTDELIQNRVVATRPDLVVKSSASQDGGLHRADLKLAADSPVPILIARSESWRQPARLAVSLEMSAAAEVDKSRQSLEVAVFLAAGCRGNLDVLYSERELEDEALRMKRAVTVAQLVRDLNVGTDRLQMLTGDPRVRLPPLIAARAYDVLVVGVGAEYGLDTVSGPDGIQDVLAEVARGDVVLVRGSAHPETRMGSLRYASGREQRVD